MSIKNIDSIYKSEMNFVDEFNLSRNGMISEIEQEFNIIRLCLQQTRQLDEQYKSMIERIMVMPLRKLLCEDSSVLLKVCPDFKMPPLSGRKEKIDEMMYLVCTPFTDKDMNEWIPVGKWLMQIISWSELDKNSIAQMIPQSTYDYINKRLNSKPFRNLKNEFNAFFRSEQVKYQGELMKVYIRKYPNDDEKNTRIYEILSEIGYNKLTVYNFIKHLSDKRGAHIDVGNSPIMNIINYADNNGITPIHCFAIQMIYAAKKQIPELNAYWPEMPDILRCENN